MLVLYPFIRLTYLPSVKLTLLLKYFRTDPYPVQYHIANVVVYNSMSAEIPDHELDSLLHDIF